MSIDSHFERNSSLSWKAGLLLLCLACAQALALPSPQLDLNFDALAQGVLPKKVTIKTQFAAPDVVPGVVGSAWRTDGFSSYAEADVTLDPHVGFTLSLWVALESFPSDLEVPTNELSPSSIAQQWDGDAGFDLFLDTYGRWGFKLTTADGPLRIAAPARIPLLRWTHLVASVNAASGVVSLYQDGQVVGTANGKPGMSLKLASVPLRLARAATEAKILDFTVNRLNAAYDQIALYAEPMGAAQLPLLRAAVPTPVPLAGPSLVVPASRFATDPLRPRVHPMPPANWTNEPHGLIRVGDVWHLFYQRTPNGPYKTQMHWGHMSSVDLVSWSHLPDALWPELQTDHFGYDMKGIWSGSVIADGGKVFAFYTSVNHGDRLTASNPGIAMAVSEDAQLRDWRKLGPVLNSAGLRDFRDPYLWKTEDTWHMLVGAALDSGGGLAYYVLEHGERGAGWKRQARFAEPGFRQLDPGSEIWEMPVFEQLSDQVWVLLANPMGGTVSKYGQPATRAVYWTGTWTNGVFKPHSTKPLNLDLVPGHLAPTVGRAADGQLRAIGIIDERRSPASQKRAGWAHTFSLPRIWFLMPDQRTLGQAPAPELRALRGEQLLSVDRKSIGADPLVLGEGLQSYELQMDLVSTSADVGQIVFEVLASADGRETTRLTLDPGQGTVTVDQSHASLSGDREGPPVLQGTYDTAAFGPMRTLRVFVDGSVIEVFVNDAAAYAVRSYPSLPGSTQVRASVTGLQPVTAKLQLWPLRQPSDPSHTQRSPGRDGQQ